MKKVASKNKLTKSVEKLNKLCSGEGTSVYREPIVPDDCRTFDEATAQYVRENIKLYIKSWILPNIEDVIAELSK